MNSQNNNNPNADGSHHFGSYLVSRRGLLIGMGATGALLVGSFVKRQTIARSLVPLLEESGVPNAAADGNALPTMWFEVPKNGPIVLYSPKVEMGQGIHTVVTQLALEELSVLPSQLVLRDVPITRSPIFPDNSRGFGAMAATAGSGSTRDLFGPLRQSAATLREMLLIEGALQLKVSRSELQAIDGTVVVKNDPSRNLAYGQIVANRQGGLGTWLPPEGPVPLKSARNFQVIGTDFPRVDAPAKVIGTATYGFDARLPDMLYGAVVHPPRYGAILESGSAGAAATMPGVIKVVIDVEANFVGVVAKTRGQAQRASARLELRWKGGSTADSESIANSVASAKTVTIRETGNAPAALQTGSDGDKSGGKNGIVEARYETALAAHAHLEPISALANVNADSIDVWVCTQQAASVAAEVQQALKKSRVVTVRPVYLGGSFGRKFTTHAASEAARLSEAAGKPVHVGWTREQDMAAGPFRPPAIANFRGRVDSKGQIVAINQESRSVALGQLPVVAVNALGFDPFAMQGQFLPYKIDNYRVRSGAVTSDVPTGIWRGVGLLPNVFGIESFMDELAVSAQIDPLTFRLNHLAADDATQRLKRVLQEVAQRSDWNKPLPAGTGRGIACSGSSGASVAVVVRVKVESTSVRVEQVHVCADPGLVINPAGARLQLAGAVMMSLSSAFHEKLTFKNGMVVEQNFDEYPILGPGNAPPIDVHLMGSGDVPGGLGEPGVGPVAAAVANAIFAASGQRHRELPFRVTLT